MSALQKARLPIFLSSAFALIFGLAPHAQLAGQNGPAPGDQADARQALPGLRPTAHIPLPGDLSQMWLAPDRTAAASRTGATIALQSAVKLIGRGDYLKAETTVSQQIAKQGPLGLYSIYYAGVAQLQAGRPTAALRSFQAVRAQKPIGYLSEAAALGEASADEALKDPAAAVAVYEQLLKERPSDPVEALMRLGLAARLIHERNKAADAFGRVYYEFALSERAADAAAQLDLLQLEPAEAGTPRYQLDVGRADRLFSARQYTEARTAFNSLRGRAAEADKDLFQLRLAECNYYLKQTRVAREALRPFMDSGQRQAEALHFFALASRELKDDDTFLSVSRRVVDEFPTESWAQEALNNLIAYHVRRGNDEEADALSRELYLKYSHGRYAERAAWRIGWRAYRQQRYQDALNVFEHASMDFPRSDFRPSWLYWSARAYGLLDQKPAADQRLSLVVTDYQNSYYGRLALARLGGRVITNAALTTTAAADVPLPSDPPPNAPTIRALLAAEMYDDAVNEVRYAQRSWSDSPMLQATLAWANHQLAAGRKGTEQFELLRGSINTMRRAYPQFLTADGTSLPRDVLTVIFPLSYWDLIRQQSAAHGLDPYLVAALVAQESTFVADIRSSANAYGLMQLIPSTARAYARKLKLKYSSSLLTRPETNIRMGTEYFADLMKTFGEAHLALAGYNAGDRPVKRWLAERPGIDREEFIDDIPYPETQNYVKRILGTADDYRRLYGPASESAANRH